MTTDLFRQSGRMRVGLFVLCLLFLIALLIWALVLDWRLNPQYHYGFFVPLLVALLVWRAAVLRPQARVRDTTGIRIGILLVPAVLAVVDVVHSANPDWRLCLWVYGLVVLLGIFLLLECAGGWGRWFAGAFALMLFAIPWPTVIEQGLIQGMMRVVASVSSEVCNLIGIPVESRGNVLRLSSGEWVGVEDACSGVRSLQAGMMAAYFFGRWMWLGVWRSLLLLLIAVGLSFLFNILRALGLTMLAHFDGVEAVARWHDFAGNSVAVLVFVVLLVVALKFEIEPRRRQREPVGGGASWVPALALAMLVCVPSFSAWWFANGSGAPAGKYRGINWVPVPGVVSYLPIPDRARTLLRYSEGRHGWWETEAGLRFDLFDFIWEEGMISSFGEIHRPDVCLPAAGLEIVSRDLEWRRIPVGGELVTVERFVFENAGWKVRVFFCAWDLNGSGEGVPLVTGFADRLLHAWEHRRVEGRRVVQVLVSGSGMEEEQVDAEIEGLLLRVLR